MLYIIIYSNLVLQIEGYVNIRRMNKIILNNSENVTFDVIITYKEMNIFKKINANIIKASLYINEYSSNLGRSSRKKCTTNFAII